MLALYFTATVKLWTIMDCNQWTVITYVRLYMELYSAM